MRILHVIAGLSPDSGGPAVALLGLAAEQVRRGHAVTVLAAFEAGEPPEYTDRLMNAGVSLHRVGPCSGFRRNHRDLGPRAKELVPAADVVHLHGLWEEVHWAASRAAVASGVPYLLRPCGMLAPWCLRQGAWKKKAYMAWRLRRMIAEAGGLHFTTEEERTQFRQLGIPARTAVVPNGIDWEEFQVLPRRAKAATPRRLLFFGRVHPKKEPGLLIQAFAHSVDKDWELFIAGPGGEGFLAELKNYAEALGVGGRVSFPGPLYGSERVALLASADLFVLPSRQENFGIAVVEAAACGTPVLISKEVNIYREVEHAAAGEAFPLEAEALSEVLSRWTRNLELRKGASVCARRFARRYRWPRVAERLHAVYEKLRSSLRINVVTGPFLSVPPAPAGAVEMVMSSLAEEFARAGCRVRLLARHHRDLASRRSVRVPLIPLPPYAASASLKVNLLKDLMYTIAVLWCLPRAQITITNGFWMPLVLPRLRPDAGKIHVQVQRVPKGQMGWYRRAGVHRLAAVSCFIADCIRGQDPDSSALVRVFCNPIDLEAFRGTEAKIVNPPRIVYTGRIHPEKGLDLLVKAWLQVRSDDPGLRSIELHLVGPWETERGGGGEDFQAELKGLAGPAPLVFHGPVAGRGELAAHIKSSRVYVYPSTAEQGEASPVAPLEAMATGIPVVVSDLGQFRDYLKPGVSGFVFDHRAPSPERELAAVLSRVLHMAPQELRPITEAAAASASRFSASAVAARYLEDFHELVRARK